jgi:adenylate cyclase
VPVASEFHAVWAADLALDLIEALERYDQRTGSALQVRIGLATGPAMASLVGRHLFLYDLFGEAVNTASRMESHGVNGRAQLSEGTRRLLAEPFRLEERGLIQVEGLGEVKTWFLVGRDGAPG